MKNFFNGRHPAWGLRRPASLKDNLHTILHGSNQEKERVKGKFFYMADTPNFMKKLGLAGEYFSVRYGVIARHQGKDADHRLTKQNWLDLCGKIADPLAIVLICEKFRLFTDVQVNGRGVVVCVDVKNTGKNLSVNSVSTAFGYRGRLVTGEILYKSKKMTPEQTALLDRPDAMSLPPVQETDLNIS